MGKSNIDLLEQVEASLLPLVPSLHLTVLEHSESDSFDNATVTLQAGHVRVRILRERSQVFVDLGSGFAPQTWFDSAVVMDHLGLSDEAGFHDRGSTVLFEGIGSFLRSFWGELTAAFDPANFAATDSALRSLRDARAASRLGFKQGGGAA
jgi:hypothetical protein